MLLTRVAGFLGMLLSLVVSSALASDWIWSSDAPGADETVYFRRAFDLPADVAFGDTRLAITADNLYVLFVNGQRIATGDNEWQSAEVYDIGKLLVAGPNVVAVQARNQGGQAALMVDCKLKVGTQTLDLSSGKDWSVKNAPETGWHRAGKFNWPAAHVLGPVGKTAPWGEVKIAQTVKQPEAAPVRKTARKPFALQDGDSIVWLGGTYIERAQRYGWLETELHAAMPDRKLRFRNLGWSGDTVLAESRGIFDPPAQGYARMLQWVRDIKPSVVVLNYGANESFGGESGLPTFLANYEKLLDDLGPTNAEFVLMTPHSHLEMPAPLPSPEARNRNIQLYGDAIVELAKSRQLSVIDLRQLSWKGVQPTQASDNGLHFNDLGNRVVASQIPAIWFGNGEAASIRVTTDKADADSMKFPWKSTSLKASNQANLQVSGLKDGNYEVVVDGTAVAKLSAAELAAGRPVSLTSPKVSAAVEALRQKVIEKDTMFFHRWRPQNVTYLFLFRKHEQGNNAKEVEEFEAIVAKLDDEIHRLKQPVEQTIELRRIDR